MTVKQNTGYSPYYLMYGTEPLLPVDLAIPTWDVLPWEEVHTTEELLAMRARHLERRDEDMEEAVLRLRRKREDGRDAWNLKHNVTDRTFEVGDMVRIFLANKEKGYYRIKELDGSEKKGTVSADRQDNSELFLRPLPSPDIMI